MDRRGAVLAIAVALGAKAPESIRIRADEDIHVRSLRLYLGELATVTFRTTDGGTVAGSELNDRFWGGLVRWATVDQPRLVAEQQREVLAERQKSKEGANGRPTDR